MNELTVISAPCCAPGAPPLPREELVALADRFKALADPARVAIVNRLAGADEVCVCVFVGELGLSQPTVSHHLRVLREAGLVEARRRGTWAFYRLLPEAVASLGFALTGHALAGRPRRREGQGRSRPRPATRQLPHQSGGAPPGLAFQPVGLAGSSSTGGSGSDGVPPSKRTILKRRPGSKSV
jgi:ArsR family transcriptional regulator, arsenate/arsenite/antimonite-responsive transcriptional repressor